MREIRFGIAGLKDSRDLQASMDFLAAGGYRACEVQFVKEFTLKEPEAKLLGSIARDRDIALSVHAPYFAQLTTMQPERLKLHLGALHHSCKLAAQMGAPIVVCHPGSRHGAGPGELQQAVGAALEAVGPRIADTGVKLGLETCGRKSQFGSLGDIALLVGQHPFTAPVIDYAHIHALSNGSLKSPEAFRALFDYITREFGWEHLWPLHTHFSDNEFGPAGEIRHVAYGQGTLRIGNLLEGAAEFDLALTVISEHKEPESHAAVLKELKARQKPAQSGSVLWERPWLPRPLPLVKRGGAHWFLKGHRQLRITNIDKPLFPDDGLTKGDLAAFYLNVAPRMLHFLKNRPISRNRVPNGIYGQSFYEKQAPAGAPDWLTTVPVRSRGGQDLVDYVIIQDVADLLWLAQVASIECHAWTSRWPNLDEPDFAVLDLDPHEPISFDEVKRVALLVKVLLDRLKLTGFPKTSGGSGIQVFIPLGPGHTFAEVRMFCAAIGGLLRGAYPQGVTLEPQKSKRAGKVYIDVDQNAKGQTLVAPYSVRPYPGAPVSTPLEWSELEHELYPEQLTMTTVFEHLRGRPDPFAPALSLKQDLRPVLRQIAEGARAVP